MVGCYIVACNTTWRPSSSDSWVLRYSVRPTGSSRLTCYSVLATTHASNCLDKNSSAMVATDQSVNTNPCPSGCTLVLRMFQAGLCDRYRTATFGSASVWGMASMRTHTTCMNMPRMLQWNYPHFTGRG